MKKKYYPWKYSLTARLLGLFIIMALLLTLIIGGNIAFSFKNNFKENVRPHLVQYLEYIQSDIGSPPDIEKAKALANRLPVEVTILGESINWSSNQEPVDISEINYYRMFEKDNLKYKMGEYNNREYLVIQQNNQTLLFSIPHPHKHFKLRHVVPLALTLILLIALYFSAKRIFSPIIAIENGIKRIGQGELDYRIRINREDELGSLANSINAMADEVQNMLNTKRHTLLAISHELRSPVTRAKVAIEMLENEKQKRGIAQDLTEIEKITEEILETERLSSQHKALNIQKYNLKLLLEEIIQDHFSPDWLDLESTPECLAAVDGARIKLLMKNLISNSLEHNKDSERKPLIKLYFNQDNIEFSVTDYGKGLSESQLSHVTEPFYRVDPSRQRETGGYGLGLYLCKKIVEAHGGELAIKSEVGEGTTVLVKLR